MAPEMFEESNFDLFKADVWAMGVVFYKVFSGNYPFKH
jgi:serine/threonine protein kinase